MRAFSTFLFAILALVRIALATPPACLIAAIGVQTNPADLKALCGSLETQVIGNITEKCSGVAYSSATSLYAATCLSSESVTISFPATTSSKSSTATGSVSAKTTSTGTAQTTATGTGASAASKSGTSTATGTASAASSTSKSSADSTAPHFLLAAVAFGVAGLVL